MFSLTPSADRYKQGNLPSLKRVFLLHSGLSVLVFGFFAGIVALAISFFGDADHASPSVNLPLFSQGKADGKPVLKQRLPDASSATAVKPHRITITHDKSGYEDSPSLPGAPVREVHKKGKFGVLPGIAEDGRRPAQVYAKPYTPTSNAKIGIILGGLGQNSRLTEKAIRELPAAVSLSFVPYAMDLQGWIDKARASGHEVLLEIPMEPYDYPNNDPGPHTLLIANDIRENKRRLAYLLSRGFGYFGLINYQGEKFVTSTQALTPLLAEIQQHGLAFIHDGAAPRSEFPELASKADMDFAVADRILDVRPNALTIKDQFLQLEALSLENGQALGAGFAYPVTLEQLSEWTAELPGRGFDLVPASWLAGVRGSPS